MTWRFFIRSRRGNIALGVVGAIEAVAALAVLILYVVSHWHAVTFSDRILQLALLGSAALAALFCASAVGNLGGWRRRDISPSASARAHRRAAAASL